jgi:hypothetical protein
MSTSVTFANMTPEAELVHSRQGQLFAGYGIPTGRRIEGEPGERGDLELTRQGAVIGIIVNDPAEPVPLNLWVCNLASCDGKTGEVEQRVSAVPTVAN